MTCGYCQQPIKRTMTAEQPFGAMHIKCYFVASEKGELRPTRGEGRSMKATSRYNESFPRVPVPRTPRPLKRGPHRWTSETAKKASALGAAARKRKAEREDELWP